jgi:type IV secretion system protein VirD4
MSKRTEETALLPGDEACRMDLDDIVLVVDVQMPVRAKRIKYYEDRFFKGIFDKQPDGSPDVQAYRNATARVDQFLENEV